MKPESTKTKESDSAEHGNAAKPISFHSLTVDAALSRLLKVKPEPKPAFSVGLSSIELPVGRGGSGASGSAVIRPDPEILRWRIAKGPVPGVRLCRA
jgi:hypothetical protein